MSISTIAQSTEVIHNFIQRPKPFLKWAGGKRQLLPAIRAYLPRSYKNYFEPFVGAGALLFNLQPQNGVINDTNSELINCYNVIKTECDELIAQLKKHKNDKEYFYFMRELDRNKSLMKMSAVERASRIIYLNKTCYNGLFRVNSHGQFNAPFGNYKKPEIVNEQTIRAVSAYLKMNNIEILNLDFADALQNARRGDFVYLDPPYYPISDTSSFTGYTASQFGQSEQNRLRVIYEELTLRGCTVMLSNSACGYIEELYEDYNIIRVKANRNINSAGTKRKKIDEFLVLNYTI